jgi:hypothetical protein
VGLSAHSDSFNSSNSVNSIYSIYSVYSVNSVNSVYTVHSVYSDSASHFYQEILSNVKVFVVVTESPRLQDCLVSNRGDVSG